jgi:hypothetical protein
MKDQVKVILERELLRLNSRSETEGLGLNDFKALDLLIKACKTFTSDESNPAETPEVLSDEELLKGLPGE